MSKRPPTPIRKADADAPADESRRQLRIQELKDEANGHHQQFVGSLRAAILEHALKAGQALIELKAILGRGNWGRWLRESGEWKASPETANVYMNVARNEDRIKAAGLDHLTLETVRNWLADTKDHEEAEPAAESEPADEGDQTASPDPAEPAQEPAAGSVEESTAEPGEMSTAVIAATAENQNTRRRGSEPKNYRVTLSADRLGSFKRMLHSLHFCLGGETEHDCLYNVVEEKYKEACP